MSVAAALLACSFALAAEPAAPDEHTLTLDDGAYVDVAGKGIQITDGPISLQVWFRTTGAGGKILETGMENRASDSAQAGYALYFAYPGRVRFGANNSPDPNSFTYDRWDNAATRKSYSDGQWHHVTCVFHADGTTRVQLYMDGVPVPEEELERVGSTGQPVIGRYTPSFPTSRIGAVTTGVPLKINCFEGELDELRIWRLALGPEEVARNYRLRVPADAAGLVAQWSFDPGPDSLRDPVSGHVGQLRQALPLPALAYDYSRYPGGLTGYTGYEREQIAQWTLKPAARRIVGERGLCEPAVAVLANGVLVVGAGTYGKPAQGLRFFQSMDNGASWSEVTGKANSVGGRRPRMLCPDGRSLLLRVAGGEVYRSTDGGANWAEAVTGAAWPLPEIPHQDASIVSLAEDRILAAVLADGDSPIAGRMPPRGYPRPEGDRSGDHSVLVESSDGGAGWSAPRSLLGYSETDAHLLRLADGRLLCTYHNMHVPFGIMALLSSDDGKTWDTDHPIFLARAWGPLGGWPSSVQLRDGSVLTVHCIQAYRNEGRDTLVETVRWQLAPAAGHASTIAGIAPLADSGMPPHDLENYPASLYGYSGVNRQQIACLSRQAARRVTIGDHRGMYKGALARLPDDTLIATPNFRWMAQVHRSTDGGRSWQFVGRPPAGGKELGAAVLRDGTILNLAGWRVYRSADRGRSWQSFDVKGATADGPVTPPADVVRNVIENEDTSLIMVFGEIAATTGTGAPPSRGWRLVSRDGGRSWTESAEIPVWEHSEDMFGEFSMIRLSDGRLLGTSRVNNAHLHGGKPPAILYPSPRYSEYANHMVLIESADDGLTWSPPRDFLGYSEVHGHLLQLADGRLLCSYASYHLPLGVFAVLSEDNGKTWSTQHPVQLGISTRVYTGWPSSVQLRDGHIVTMYATAPYVGNDDYTLAETVRWTLPPRGSIYPE